MNPLDFTSVVVPVTVADRDADVRNEVKPLSEVDVVVQGECKY